VVQKQEARRQTVKNRFRWVIAALLLMGVVWASAATLSYGFNFGTGSAGGSGGGFQMPASPAAAVRAIRNALLDGYDNKVTSSNQSLLLSSPSYAPIKVAIDTNPMVGRDISFNDWTETTEPSLISAAAQPESFALLPTQFVAIGGSAPPGNSLGISDPTVVIDPTIPPPVPEPETWAMLLAGLLVMVFVSRRRAPR